MIAQLLLGMGAAVSAVAGARVLALLKSVWNRRTERDESVNSKKDEIVNKITHSSEPKDAMLADVIDSLEGVENAVVIIGEWAIVKDSVAGKPHMSVRRLSPRQRELIHNREAPINDAAAFQTWLDTSRVVT